MTILSSRPDKIILPSDQDFIRAATPAINVVQWLSTMTRFHDDHPASIRAGLELIEEALDCMVLWDFNVIPIPSLIAFLSYDVAVKGIPGPFVCFRTKFAIQP